MAQKKPCIYAGTSVNGTEKPCIYAETSINGTEKPCIYVCIFAECRAFTYQKQRLPDALCVRSNIPLTYYYLL